MEPNNRIEDFILITERLIEILERENDALLNQQNGELRDILDDKVTLSRVYESRMKAISENPEILDDIDPDVRQNLRELGLHVNDLITENAKLLKTAITVSRRVVELIADAVRDAAPNAGTYGAKGTTESGVTNADSQRASFSLNQTL